MKVSVLAPLSVGGSEEERLTVGHQENCSKGIDPPNNSYMTDVMIAAELLLLRETQRV